MKLEDINKWTGTFKNEFNGKTTEIEIYNSMRSITVCTQEQTTLVWYSRLINTLKEKNDQFKQNGSISLETYNIKIIKI